MKFILSILIFFNFSIAKVYTEETRQVDKHEHGVGELNIATERDVIEFEFMIPGADIVGFEYVAKSEADIASIKKALQTFENYENIFTLPKNSRCQLTEKQVALKEDEDDHDDHEGHDDHDDHEGHDDHDDHEGHDEHAEENHNEFYAKYSFECGDIKAINNVEFPYFSTFPNSGELEVQFISSIGSVSFEVEAEEPSINIDGKI
jgi:hypothetical protein